MGLDEARGELFDLSPDMLCVSDFNGQFTLVNDAWTEILGYSKEELTGRPYFDFVHPDDIGATESEADSLSDGNETIYFENRYRTKSGEYKWISWRSRPNLEHGVIYGAARDITHEKDLQAEADRLKDEFVSLVSHELRTPLTSIIGYLEVLMSDRENLNIEQLQFLEVIERNSRRLHRLVGDLLFTARVEAGEVELDVGEVDLSVVVSDAVEAASRTASSKQIELVDGVGELPIIRGDADRLGQLLDNLISNAIRYTPEGGEIAVESELEDGWVELRVRDSGIGIPAAELARVFDRFFRTSRSQTMVASGAGLGLAICKSIVETHGGTINLQSVENQGTTVIVRLPVNGAIK